MLSAVILSTHSYSAMRLASQPKHQRCVHSGPLVLRTASLKSPTPTVDRDRTVSRRSKPSSRTTLNGEHLYTISGLWFVVYSVVYTLYHIPPVVRCLYTTSGLWFSIYSIIHTIFNHYNEESKKYWENQIWWQLNNLCK